jgi:hypothetical protein
MKKMNMDAYVANLFLAGLLLSLAGPARAEPAAPIPEGLVPTNAHVTGVYVRKSGVNGQFAELARRQFEEAKTACPAYFHKQARVISGRVEDAGKWEGHEFITASQSAEYVNSYHMTSAVPGDMCSFRVDMARLVTIKTISGSRTYIVDYDAVKRVGKGQYVTGQRLFTSSNPDQIIADPHVGYVDTGKRDKVAGIPCRVMESRLLKNNVTESCVADWNLPKYAARITLRVKSTTKGNPPAVIEGQADELIPNAEIDTTVFQVPKGIIVRDLP